MKINIFYIFSKIYLLSIISLNLILNIFSFIYLNAKFTYSISIILSIIGIYYLFRLKNSKKLIRYIFIFLLFPIGLYFSLNVIVSIINTPYFKEIFSLTTNLYLLYIVNISYYFVPSLLLMMAYKYEFLSSIGDNKKIKVPEIITFIFEILIFIIPSLIVLSQVFQFELTSILATSGVLAAVIGFGLQANLSNMLSGIFVNIERPFNQDDWITIDQHTGLVIDVTWRSTRLRTWENTEVTIPNEVVANAVIVNWSNNDKSQLSEGYRIFTTLHFHPKHDPQHISQLIKNALKKVKPADGRPQLDFQWVKFIDVNEYGLKFLISFDCIDRMQNNSQKNIVLLEIHKTLSHSGINMSAGKMFTQLDNDVGLNALQTVRIKDDFEPVKASEFNPYNESIKNKVLLNKIPIFMSLKENEIQELANNCKRVNFKSDDFIINQGDPGNSLFIIADGVVGVHINNKSKEMILVAKLGVGDFFGEMSLMTGEPRSANIIAESPTVTLVVEKDIIKKIFNNNPEVFDYVSSVLASRKLTLDKSKTDSVENGKKIKNIAEDLKKAIINFLS